MESRSELEQALIAAFVVPAKRERFLGMLGHPKRRKKFLDGLHHFEGLDPRYQVAIPAASQHARGVEAMLREWGAGGTCQVISTDRELDGRSMDLAEALDLVHGSCAGTLLGCVPGKLGYYEGEHPADRRILRR
ncbi:MAG: hypothetical protein P1V81_12405 [Planctomycetota bacterium]|nr:hypothetical protein [Planctomycetota bacterium]